MTLKLNGTNSEAAPAYAGDDADTGLQCGTNELKLVTGGTARATVDSDGRLLVGTDAAINTGNSPSLEIVDTGSAVLSLGRNDSTISANNILGSVKFFGNDGGSYQQCAEIAATADGTHANDDKPTRLVLSTTADGANSPTERMRIDSSGRVGIGADSFNDSRERLRVQAPSGESGTFLTIKSPDTSGTSAVFFGDDDFNEGRIEYNHGNNSLNFHTDDAVRASILSGGGLTFNGDTASANALDDYEEGTWTPVDGEGDAFNQGKQATYTKIGRVVYLHFDITGTASANGGAVKGLPFNAISATNAGGNFVFSHGYASGIHQDVVAHTGSDSIEFFVGASSTQLNNGQRVIMSGFYFTA